VGGAKKSLRIMRCEGSAKENEEDSDERRGKKRCESEGEECRL
jgi:hypothetical protein